MHYYLTSQNKDELGYAVYRNSKHHKTKCTTSKAPTQKRKLIKV